MIETRGGFLISQIKQIQGRVFGRLLTEAGIDEFNGAQGHIIRCYDPKDRRQIRICLTDNARKLEILIIAGPFRACICKLR